MPGPGRGPHNHVSVPIYNIHSGYELQIIDASQKIWFVLSATVPMSSQHWHIFHQGPGFGSPAWQAGIFCKPNEMIQSGSFETKIAGIIFYAFVICHFHRTHISKILLLIWGMPGPDQIPKQIPIREKWREVERRETAGRHYPAGAGLTLCDWYEGHARVLLSLCNWHAGVLFQNGSQLLK